MQRTPSCIATVMFEIVQDTWRPDLRWSAFNWEAVDPDDGKLSAVCEVSLPDTLHKDSYRGSCSPMLPRDQWQPARWFTHLIILYKELKSSKPFYTHTCKSTMIDNFRYTTADKNETRLQKLDAAMYPVWTGSSHLVILKVIGWMWLLSTQCYC